MPMISPTAISPHNRRGISWQAYWATHFAALQTTLDGQSNLNFWAKSRSGLSFIDEYSHNASILVPTGKFNGSNNHLISGAKITGGTAWDCTIKLKLSNAAGVTPILNCGGYTNAAKGVMIRVNNGTINVFSSDGTNSVSGNFTTGLTNNVLYTIRFQWSGVSSETMTITTNGVSSTSTNNKGWSGDSNDFFGFGKYSTAFGNISLQEASGTFGGSTYSLFPNGLSTYEFGIAETPIRFQWYGDAGHLVYDSGTTHYLDNGYSIWKDGSNVYQYVPNTLTGTFLNVITYLGGTYANLSQHAGSTTKHNLWDSYIRFAGDFFDRSNTTIWNATSRESAYYLSGTPKDLHITELNYRTLKSWLNDGYKGKFYIKADTQSVEDTTTIDELFCYTTDRKSHDQIKSLIYSNDVRCCQRDLTGDYIFDSDNYAEIYFDSELGGDAEANYAYYQGRLNSGNVTIGINDYDITAISQPLIPPAGRTLTINGELRIKNGTTVDLTSDVTAGDTVINVSSVIGFNVGEWVGISDGVLAIQAGSNQTRRVGASGRITEIGESTITIHSGSVYNVASASGHLGHCQGCVIVQNDGCTVNGTGVINGNWEQQYDCEPVATNLIEEVLAGCGIVVKDAHNTTISGSLEIKNALLHGIMGYGLAIDDKLLGLNISGVNAHHNHDKNITFFRTHGAVTTNCQGDDALFEDGMTYYLQNTGFIINNCSTARNSRYGLCINANGTANGDVNGIDLVNDDLYIMSSAVALDDVTMTGSGYLYIDDHLVDVTNVVFNTITITDLTEANIIRLLGNLSDIIFNDLTIDGCSGTGITIDEFSGGGEFPQGVEFNGGGIYNHTGTAYAIDASADVTFTDFDNAPV